MKDERGISVRMVRSFDLPQTMPSFDHVPTEEGREASRRLWIAAFGEPVVFTSRLDVMWGFATLRPELAVKVIS